jgi:hypothetical protein
MDNDTQTLTKEVASLRLEVQQLRDLVRMLLEMMMDNSPDDDEPHPSYPMSPYFDGGRVTGEDFKGLGM